jgi:glycosyltransferase involved in cell wall biosynthesis
MRIAMVGLRAPGAEGGVEGSVAALAPRLVDRGCAVTVFTRPAYNRDGDGWRGVRLVDVPTVDHPHLEAIVHTLRCIPRALGFDLVHVHAVGNALLAFVPRLAGVPVVVTAHAPDWRREKWGPVARLALRTGAIVGNACADAVIAVSADTARAIGGQPTVIPNGVEPLPFAELAEAGVQGLVPGFLLYLGRLVPEKRVDLLLAAHAAAGDVPPLVIAGSAPRGSPLGDALRRAVRSDVRFVGSRTGAAKAALLHHAGAVVSASRVEGLPLAILEGMAHARAIVASDIAPHRELVTDGVHGRLVAGESVAAWADALRRARNAEAHGLAGRARALAEFGWDPIADRTVGLYREVLRRRPRRV